ncbi:MAG: TraB domain-containing protein [Thermoplasmata archaeon]
MIRIIGIIHVLDLTVKINSLIDYYSPSSIAIELDYKRLEALENKEEKREFSLIGLLSGMQKKIASNYHVIPGSEMLAAYKKGKMNGLPVFLIDENIDKIYEDLKKIPFREKFRLILSAILSSFSKKTSLEEMIENEEIYMKRFEKYFPKLYDLLITRRNRIMAEKIREIEKNYGSVMVFTGDAHVEGLKKLLPDAETIRLKELLKMQLPNNSFNFSIKIS